MELKRRILQVVQGVTKDVQGPSINGLRADPRKAVCNPITKDTHVRVSFIGLDPVGHFLYAANEQGDTVVTFRVDGTSGKLTPTGQVTNNASPVTIVFAGK